MYWTEQVDIWDGESRLNQSNNKIYKLQVKVVAQEQRSPLTVPYINVHSPVSMKQSIPSIVETGVDGESDFNHNSVQAVSLDEFKNKVLAER